MRLLAINTDKQRLERLDAGLEEDAYRQEAAWWTWSGGRSGMGMKAGAQDYPGSRNGSWAPNRSSYARAWGGHGHRGTPMIAKIAREQKA